MAVITYVAVDRGLLASGHSATTQYQIETSFWMATLTMNTKGMRDEALDGTQEGWVQAIQKQWSMQSDYVLTADVEDWRELFSSVAAGETFQIDFTGTIASPGTDVDVALVDTKIQEKPILGVGVQYSFTVKAQ